MFTNVVAKWPGSTHDAFIMRNSNVWDEYEGVQLRGIILGDRANKIEAKVTSSITNIMILPSALVALVALCYSVISHEYGGGGYGGHGGGGYGGGHQGGYGADPSYKGESGGYGGHNSGFGKGGGYSPNRQYGYGQDDSESGEYEAPLLPNPPSVQDSVEYQAAYMPGKSNNKYPAPYPSQVQPDVQDSAEYQAPYNSNNEYPPHPHQVPQPGSPTTSLTDASTTTTSDISSTSTTTANPSSTSITTADPSSTSTTTANPSSTSITTADPSSTSTTTANPSSSSTTTANPSSSSTTTANPSSSSTTTANPSSSSTTTANPSSSSATPITTITVASTTVAPCVPPPNSAGIVINVNPATQINSMGTVLGTYGGNNQANAIAALDANTFCVCGINGLCYTARGSLTDVQFYSSCTNGVCNIYTLLVTDHLLMEC
uniref:Uncharacterized protein n=1 Tax=Ditylenchus dipsaci TaxID=166011 RepID=A0A915EBV9_9BILA